MADPSARPCAVLRPTDLQALLGELIRQGVLVVGPVRRGNAIVYDAITSTADLPAGITDRQEPGRYQLEASEQTGMFGYACGPASWRQWLMPARSRLWAADRGRDGLRWKLAPQEAPRMAFFGIRPCELRALAIHDRVCLEGPYQDPGYRARRAQLFLVAVNCSRPGGTCFCSSMGCGPDATTGFDIALTELTEGEPRLLAVAGSDAGARVLDAVPHRPAMDADRTAAAAVVRRARESMGRRLETAGLKELLYRNTDHARWEHVAERCLSCGNCTMVCPTCFCSTTEDVTDVTGGRAERWRRWDSCFTLDFSYIHGGSVRGSVRSRYRQWLMHKLAYWHDQFGSSGCVGCGRCITWCPVGIDLTEEVRAIRAADQRQKEPRPLPGGDQAETSGMAEGNRGNGGGAEGGGA